MEEEHSHNKKHVRWDEEKLKETQKFRGTFEKIDQPKTPYRKNEESDEDEIQPVVKSQEEIALEESLHKAKMNSQANNHRKVNIQQLNAKLKEELQQFHSGHKSQMEDEEQQQKHKKKQDFKKKRAQHYNEFQLIKKMKEQRWQEQDD